MFRFREQDFEGLKESEWSTKLFIVLNRPWEARKYGRSEEAVGRSEYIFVVPDNAKRIEEDLIEAERVLNRG